jgi:hypothetical protein
VIKNSGASDREVLIKVDGGFAEDELLEEEVEEAKDSDDAEVDAEEDWMHTPEQSAPPMFGSHVSDGSSVQANPSGQGNAAMPPQAWREAALLATSKTVTSVTRSTGALPETFSEPRTSTRLPTYDPNCRLISVD